MEKKKNSIEWLVQELNRNIDFIPNVHHWDKIRDIIQQAKEMHKKEIIKASARGYVNSSDGFPLQEAINYAEQYYKETFGGQDNE